MKRHLNTLYVATEGTYLAKEGECLVAKVDNAVKARIPVAGLDSVVCIGRISYSPQVLAHCAENGVSMTHLSDSGRFLARMEGPVSGNVLVRRTQYRWADDPERSAALARSFLSGKILNARTVLRRGARDSSDLEAADTLSQTADRLTSLLPSLEREASVDGLRGIEGEAARHYWAAFNAFLIKADPAFHFPGRSRRPPLDPINALLSFLYTLLAHDIRSALDSAGLDPQLGYLHRERPGRPSLALDMMEEFRSILADRLALTLVNRGQIQAKGFKTLDGGGVQMDEDTRRTVITAWQARKSDERTHPFLNESAPIGLFWHLQALLLKRHMRGDLDAYPPCLWR